MKNRNKHKTGLKGLLMHQSKFKTIRSTQAPVIRSLMDEAVGHGLLEGCIPEDIYNHLVNAGIDPQVVFDEVIDQINEMQSLAVH